MAKTPKAPKESRNWYKDRYQSVLLQRRLLMGITLLSMLSTLGSVLVISRLAPLKSVEPFVIQVDQKSGITQVVDPMTVKELTANEAVNNYFVVQYIRSRETYNSTDLKRNYPAVKLMSEPSVYGAFVREADPSNPRSNTARLGTTGWDLAPASSLPSGSNALGSTLRLPAMWPFSKSLLADRSMTRAFSLLTRWVSSAGRSTL